jgi:hypothetical protein
VDASRFSPTRYAPSASAPANWFDAREGGDGVHEALFPRRRAGRAFVQPHHDHVALAAERLAHVLARHAPGQEVAGRDQADGIVALEFGVERYHRDAGADRAGNRLAQRLVVERREQEAVDAARHQRIHDLDLIFAVVFLQRALPEDLHAQFAPRLHGAGVDRLPEFVGRSLGHHRDGGCAAGLAAARERGGGQGRRQEQQDDSSPHSG